MKSLVSRVFAGLLAGTVGLALSLPAHASLTSNVTVTLSAPGGIIGDPTAITATQVATPADGIVAGDGGDIGSGWMLDGEQIVFSGNSIHITVAAGAGDGSPGSPYVSGYLGDAGLHALYLLEGLHIAGEEIVGFTAYAFDGFGTAGFSGLLSPADPTDYIALLSPSSLSFDLDTLVFADRSLGGSANHADFRIDLVTRTINPPPPGEVPEPPMLALVFAGLGVLALRRRQTANAAR
jgi:hypothetical protein